MGRGLQLRGVLEPPPFNHHHGSGQEYMDAVLESGGRAELQRQESHFNLKKSVWGHSLQAYSPGNGTPQGSRQRHWS